MALLEEQDLLQYKDDLASSRHMACNGLKYPEL